MAPTTVPTTTAAPATATPGVPLDFSTPQASLRTYFAAVRAGDRAALAACFEDPPPGVADVTPVAYHNVLARRLAVAVSEKFGPAAAEGIVPYNYYLSDRNIDEILARWPAPAKELVIDGDRAYYVNEQGRRLGRADDFNEFVRVQGEWKSAQRYPDPSDHAAVARYERWLAPKRQLERDLSDSAADVEDGIVVRFEEIRDRHTAILQRLRKATEQAGQWP